MVSGEVVAVDRHYFQNFGAYDPLMSPQSGENLEMSFKVGSMLTVDVGGISGAKYAVSSEVDVRKGRGWE